MRKSLSLNLLSLTLILAMLPAGLGAVPPSSVGVQNRFDCSDVSEIPETECEALVALYNSTEGDSWTNNSWWFTTNTPCSWHGVSCELGHITGLFLDDNQLSGPIPSEIGHLTALQVLFLFSNQLSGPIPPEIGNLTALRELRLHWNQLSGPIPPELGNLAALTDLSIGDNQLSGPIPTEMGNLTALAELHLLANQLSGPVPPEIGSLKALRVLNLNRNQLSGPIPPEIGNLTALRELRLHANQLSGPIPPEIGNLTALQELQLYSNQLSGPIPPEIGGLAALTRVIVGDNELSGPIPTEMGNLTALEELQMWSNQLSGPIPAEIGKLTALRGLFLNWNQLSGPIPSEIGDLNALYWVLLEGNQLSGAIPPQIGKLSALEVLHLHENQLSGPIPPELGKLGALRRLWLRDNQLSGPIPPEIGDLTELTHLILAGNELSGPIPPELGSLSALTTLDLALNQLSGPIPAQIGNPTALELLYLSSNQLNGPIPSEMANLTALQHLWVHDNPISGEVPALFTALTELTHFTFYDTECCVPSTSDMDTWLGGVAHLYGTGLICGEGLGSLGGSVVLSDATPAPGIEVNLYRSLSERGGWRHIDTTQTTADGTYQFTDLGQGLGIDYRVQFLDPADELVPQYYEGKFFIDTADAITVTLGVPRTGIDAVMQPIGGDTANLEVNLVLPATFGYHIPATVYVEYANTGGWPMPAPLLLVTATQDDRQGAILTLDQSRLRSGFWTSTMPEGFANSVQFLASGETPGILQPGESRRMPVYFAGWQRPWDFDYPPFEWSVGVLDADDATPADWALQKGDMRPDYIGHDAWDVVWDNFTALTGDTWGEYVAMLSANASYLHDQGQRVEDVGPLLAFAFRQAEGLSPISELAGSIDAAVQAPGLPIVFNRSYLNPISRRFELGPLGRGWTHNWQIELSTREDGTVVLTDRTGTPRIFQPDSRYPGRYLAQPGDQGTLRSVEEGYHLTEAHGTVQSFSSDGKLQYLEDTNGNRIACTYDGDRLTGLTHSAGPALTIVYTAEGLIASVTNHHGRQTHYSYSGEYLTAVESCDGLITTYSYDSASGASAHALSEIGLPDGTTRAYTYDGRGWLSTTYRDDEEESVSFTYTGNGRVDVTDALDHTSHFFFDHWGRLVKAENALGEAVRMGFDEMGNLIAVTDPDGFSTSLAYDRHGNLIEVTDALRHTTRFAYTRDFNRLAALTDALGNRTDYGHDDRGNLTSISYPDGSTESWLCDPRGNPTTWTNRRGNATAYQYDAEGRITRKTYPDDRQVNYSYDERGHLIEAEDSNGATTFTYDERDYLVRIDYPEDRWLAFSYDEAGRRASSLDQTGRRLDYHYDAAGRLERMTDETNSEIVRYAYDVVGRLARKTVGNGVYTDYSYDAAGRLASLVNRAADHTEISRFDYTYDRRGRRTEMATHYGTWSYQYDNIGQLTRAELESTDPDILDQELIYEYDALGNRIRTAVNGVEEAYSVNHLNQYTQIGDSTYTYDADGNLIEESSPDGVTVYTYDDENRLIGVSRDGDTWEYTYDPLGHRVAVDENGAVTHYVIDPIGFGNVVGEYGDAGNLLAHYDYGYGLLRRMHAGEGASSYTFDALGNVGELTSAAGVVRNVYAYRPFGETLRRETTVPNSFEFVGRWGVMADATGLLNMRARAYSSKIGRFLATDPIGLGGGDPNLYRYTGNQPSGFVDPTGESLIAIGKIIWGGWQIGLYVMTAVHLYAVYEPWVRSYDWIRYPSARDEGELRLPRRLITLRYEDYLKQASDGFIVRPGTEVWPVFRPPDLPVELFPYGATGTAGAVDPNEKTGPAGHGAENYVASGQSLAYRVDFENLESATAPAQIVTIRDPLSEYLDLSTFELTEIGFGDELIAVPAGRQNYQTVIDYAYDDDEYDFEIEVHVQAWLGDGTIYVSFFSIDPETGLPPQDVSIGFLPPENETGRGQGYFSYLIRPKADLASGTEIRNIATIQFDFGLEIDTNQVDPLDPDQGTDPEKEALVTIDSLPPTSTVDPLPAVTETEQFTVSWSGEDDEHGSGVGTYDIYVREDAGAWTIWQESTRETSAEFTGIDGHSYGFYAVAMDNVGHRESKTAHAEASTQVSLMSDFYIYLPLVLTSR